MKKFVKKPEFVEAEQWLQSVEQNERLLADGVIMESSARDGSCLVPTMGGNLPCRLNNYIVEDENGHRSVEDAETFESAYDLVEDEPEVKKVTTKNKK